MNIGINNNKYIFLSYRMDMSNVNQYKAIIITAYISAIIVYIYYAFFAMVKVH